MEAAKGSNKFEVATQRVFVVSVEALPSASMPKVYSWANACPK